MFFVNVLLSLDKSDPSRGGVINNILAQMPSTAAFHLHSNRDVWVNGQQAPNLLLGLRGQDETREMACSRHQRANSSGSHSCARKFLLRSDGKCFRSIRDKAAICIQFIYACAEDLHCTSVSYYASLLVEC